MFMSLLIDNKLEFLSYKDEKMQINFLISSNFQVIYCDANFYRLKVSKQSGHNDHIEKK